MRKSKASKKDLNPSESVSSGPVLLHIHMVEAHVRVADMVTSSSDPYCKMKMVQGSGKAKTQTIKRTLHPVWNETFTLEVSKSDELEVKVYDKDFGPQKDDLLGTTVIQMKTLLDVDHKGFSGWRSLMNEKKETQGMVYLTLYLDEVPRGDLKKRNVKVYEKMRDTLLFNSLKACQDIIEEKEEDEYKVCIGTWNVGNKAPPVSEQFDQWFKPDMDIYVIGVQECKYSMPKEKEGKKGSPGKKGDESKEEEKDDDDEISDASWNNTLDGFFLNLDGKDSYRMLVKERLSEIKIHCYVRTELIDQIHHIGHCTEATGIGGVIGNKGGTAIAFYIGTMSFCFINTHMAAHQEKTAQRNNDFKSVVKGIRNISGEHGDALHHYHHVFWMGDLNYRLDYGDQGDKRTPDLDQFDEMVQMITDEKYEELFQYDQLAREMNACRVFFGFQEGVYNFKPTFKRKRGDEGDSYTPQRSPAWCDRILWRTYPSYDIKQLELGSVEEFKTSDHKPVYSIFSITKQSLACACDLDRTTCTIKITNLKGKGLMAQDIGGTSDPYIIFQGDILDKEVKTQTKSKTLNPVWENREVPSLKCINSPTRLSQSCLIIKVMDHDVASINECMGYGLLPLGAFVVGEAPEGFGILIKKNGLPQGSLTGMLEIQWGDQNKLMQQDELEKLS